MLRNNRETTNNENYIRHNEDSIVESNREPRIMTIHRITGGVRIVTCCKKKQMTYASNETFKNIVTKKIHYCHG